jgi:ribosomal protein S18 acetylase RimI-like enzyme
VSAAQPEASAEREPIVRDLIAADLDDVVRIDALHTGGGKPDYWVEVFERFVDRPARQRVGLAAEEPGGALVGYLLGEIRAFEFGSEACGWVFSVGVDPARLRSKVATRLLAEAGRRFGATGVGKMRTMVRRNNIPMLSFFRAAGFEGGSFVELERNLEGGS